MSTLQETYDAIKVLDSAIKDKKDEIKMAEENFKELSDAREVMTDLKDQLKELKKQEKKAKEKFSKKNEDLLESLISLKNKRQGEAERLTIQCINELKEDNEIEIYADNGKRVQIDFTPKMKVAN